MTRAEHEEELEFLAHLKARSGRSLAEWMALITAQNFRDKNEAIDWLRTQNFPFARASWLERIHANGGRPIYADGLPADPPVRSAPAPRPSPPVAPSPGDVALLEKLIAGAKGYRPLYLLLEGELRRHFPGAVFKPRPACILVGAPGEFAAIALGPAEIRLGLALGDHPFDASLQPAKIRGAGPGITHMLVLKDARQVNADLLAMIAAAHAKAGGKASDSNG